MIENLRKNSAGGSARSQNSLKLARKKTYCLNDTKNCKNGSCDGAIGTTDRRKRQKRKKKRNIVRDEASYLQRRARYLLIKMKLELNLIDAYSADGWKGQSKEKIKPEKELQRAEKQILKCKLGIRDTICQLDLLSSEGRIADSHMSPDGSVFHEHIFCAKCKLREAFPDNDIILCDGTCNCAFHQKCLEPPLEKIPPAAQGWLCRFCECKEEILETINAHIGTSFTVNSSWEDVFKEATTDLITENTALNADEEWPSDDSNDEDYDPELIENSNSRTIEESMCDDASSSSSLLCSSSDVTDYERLDAESKSKKLSEAVDSIISIDPGECSDHEIISFRRQRREVDYKKLHDEMFGKESNGKEQQSDDEDWCPQRRKQRKRELDADSLMATSDNDVERLNMVEHKDTSGGRRKQLFRIPLDAVEKLRQVFSKNELPSRAIRENLAVELGISSEKVNKWFKNARYAALRIRKAEMTNEPQITDNSERSMSKAGKQTLDEEESMDDSYLLPLSSFLKMHRNSRKILHRKNSSIATPLEKQQKDTDNALPTDKIQKPRVPVEETFNSSRTEPQVDESIENEQLFSVEIERLFSLEERLQNLKTTLLTCKGGDQVRNTAHLNELNVVYVPVAEVKEKSAKHINR
ncbi:pathogenesis-related homeodomain protein isoform X2 [Asparagus officinalis]|nr:pathogenesis-related homeodomain protein isoform X2 [Asparagus officinalis]